MRRAPEESLRMYNKRTCVRIQKWASKWSIPLAHHRVQQNLFRCAWRDRDKKAPAHAVRMSRSRCWWDSVKGQPYNARKRERCSRARPGAAHLWDDPFVLVYGHGWQSTLEKCPRCRNGSERNDISWIQCAAPGACHSCRGHLVARRSSTIRLPGGRPKWPGWKRNQTWTSGPLRFVGRPARNSVWPLLTASLFEMFAAVTNSFRLSICNLSFVA